jgi:hypothetical protein
MSFSLPGPEDDDTPEPPRWLGTLALAAGALLALALVAVWIWFF